MKSGQHLAPTRPHSVLWSSNLVQFLDLSRNSFAHGRQNVYGHSSGHLEVSLGPFWPDSDFDEIFEFCMKNGYEITNINTYFSKKC